jgi:DNA-binding CsgD family transcriptional regulator
MAAYCARGDDLFLAMREDLDRLVTGDDAVFARAIEGAKELLGARAAARYTLTRGETVKLDGYDFIGMRASHVDFQASMSEVAARAPKGWGYYDASRPERWQRNRIVGEADIARRMNVRAGDSVLAPLFRRWGLGECQQIRVLVCEGPSLLLWFGVWREEPLAPRERRFLSALVPALRKRAILERRLSSAPRTRAALGAALSWIGRPAFVLGARGQLHEANALGQEWLVKRGRAGRTALADAAIRGAAYELELTKLGGRGEPLGFLAIARAEDGDDTIRRACVDRAAARWSLTPRQRVVLALVVDGLSNRTIADHLRVSERAVELHVTALLDRGGVPSRAALVARVYSIGAG